MLTRFFYFTRELLIQPRVCRLLLCCLLSLAHIPAATALVIASNPLNGSQREAIYPLITKFRALHPDIPVVLKASEHETYKAKLDQRLSSPYADIYFWFGGNRLKQFAEGGKILNLDDFWQHNQWSERFTRASKTAVSYAGKTYGVPLYYYQWGIYYRASVFSKHGLTPPETWKDLERIADELLKKGITPFTLGSRDHWPVAGWFDYLNLRLNGMDFHQKLLTGKASFMDARISAVFELWQSIRDKGYFIRTHADNDWRGALPFIYHERAAMMLMGNFFLSAVPENLQDDFRFTPFPTINADIPRYEEAPVDILIVSAMTNVKQEVDVFLGFIAQPENQSALARAMNMIPTNQLSDVGDNIHLIAGAELLKSAEGVTQFFDRDTPTEFAEPAMAVLAEFVSGTLTAIQAQQALNKLAQQHL